MKLKRCPNLHYYDGDKYDRCPHCAEPSEPTPAPAPAPKPVFEPAPQPEPIKPEQKASVETAPPAAPPAPVVAPPPVKSVEEEKPAAPANDVAWRCSCGAVNNGKFCFECGASRPVPEVKKEPAPDGKWKCRCGAENMGKFCFECGLPRPEAKPAPAVQTAPKPVLTPPPAPTPAEPVVKPVPAPKPAPENDGSLTMQINNSVFTGTMDDARKKASSGDDEGVTQVVFDEIDDGFVLAWLTVTNSSAKGKVFTLTTAKNTIGRSDPEHPVDIDLRNDRGISRGVQAMIVYDPLNKKFFLQSTGGKTFVYVNKEILLTYTELKPYDVIRVGETNLVFVPLCCEQFSW